jgi:prephenate dehydratase
MCTNVIRNHGEWLALLLSEFTVNECALMSSELTVNECALISERMVNECALMLSEVTVNDIVCTNKTRFITLHNTEETDGSFFLKLLINRTLANYFKPYNYDDRCSRSLRNAST